MWPIKELSEDICKRLKLYSDKETAKGDIQFTTISSISGIPTLVVRPNEKRNRYILQVSEAELHNKLCKAQKEVLRTGRPSISLIFNKLLSQKFTKNCSAASRRMVTSSANVYIEYVVCFMDICPVDGQLGGYISNGYTIFVFPKLGDNNIEIINTYYTEKFNEFIVQFRENREKLMMEWDHYISMEWRKNHP